MKGALGITVTDVKLIKLLFFESFIVFQYKIDEFHE